MTYGANTAANVLLNDLTADVNFTMPVIDISLPEYKLPMDRFTDMYEIQKRLTVADLTDKNPEGAGAFDMLMAGFAAHLDKEFKANRISGAEYTKAYIALAESAMQSAVQFLLQKETAFWQAQTAQMGAITAAVGMETAKLQHVTARYEANNAKAAYALTKAKLATEDATYGAAKYNIDNLLPIQLQNLTAQGKLLEEQGNAQRAQTADTRIDGAAVTGTLGKQKELYAQQIISYQRDSEVKAARIFTDAWITMKTIDEGIAPPNNFSNASLDSVLTRLRSVNNFTG